MNLIGVSLRLTDKELKIEVARLPIIKETDKVLKLNNNSELVFDCFVNIPKDKIGVVQKGRFSDSVGGFERRLWDTDDSPENEQKMIEHLKICVRNEMERRRHTFDEMLDNLNKG